MSSEVLEAETSGQWPDISSNINIILDVYKRWFFFRGGGFLYFQSQSYRVGREGQESVRKITPQLAIRARIRSGYCQEPEASPGSHK